MEATVLEELQQNIDQPLALINNYHHHKLIAKEPKEKHFFQKLLTVDVSNNTIFRNITYYK